MSNGSLTDLLSSLREFESEAHAILAQHEGTKSRAITLHSTYERLTGLSLSQQGLFEEALNCLQSGTFRAATVMAWAAFFDFYVATLCRHKLAALHTRHPKWAKHTSAALLRESITEHDLISAGSEVDVLSKADKKALHGLLSKRNECAHPTGYCPDVNETLGYVSELLNRISRVRAKFS